jgi:glycosyltransferase involved in cell wall biosynthesis
VQGVETILVTRPPTREGVFPGEVVTVRYGGGRGRHGRVLDRTLHYPRFAARLGEAVAKMVRDGRVDVVHAQGLTALGYGRLRAKDPTLRAPLVMNPQGMEEHKTRGIKRLALTRLRSLSREAARLSDRVVATDESTREEVPRLLGVEASKVVVLPNGIDADEIRDSTPAEPEKVVHRALPALEGAYPVFLSVGRLEAYKGFGDILRAMFRAESDLPARWAWVVVGEGPERQRLTRDAFAHQVAHQVPQTKITHQILQTRIKGKADGARGGPHVHVIGRVDEPLIHSLYERADVFVHATRYEGSSLVTLEAMAHGLPVVATRAGGIPDKVSVETGCLVEPGDVAGLSTALLDLSTDAALRERLGRRGRERVLELFAWPALARRTIALYEELLGARR